MALRRSWQATASRFGRPTQRIRMQVRVEAQDRRVREALVHDPDIVEGQVQGPSDRVLTIPNALSLARLVGVPFFLWLVLNEHDAAAVAVLMVSGFTDWLDGKIARRWNQMSRVGQLLDPAADRLYILATLIGLTVRDVVPLWLTIALIGRDVLLSFTLPLLSRHGYGPLPVHFL